MAQQQHVHDRYVPFFTIFPEGPDLYAFARGFGELP
jgi:hypothetical protein